MRPNDRFQFHKAEKVTKLAHLYRALLKHLQRFKTSYSYTMACPPVRGDNPRALASELSNIQADKPWYNYFYNTYISVDLSHHDVFRAKVGKGSIISII